MPGGFTAVFDEAEGIFADLLVLQRVVPHDLAYPVPDILHSGSVLFLVDQELRNLVGAEGFSPGCDSHSFHFLTEVEGFLEVWSEFHQAVGDVWVAVGGCWVPKSRDWDVAALVGGSGSDLFCSALVAGNQGRCFPAVLR